MESSPYSTEKIEKGSFKLHIESLMLLGGVLKTLTTKSSNLSHSILRKCSKANSF